MRAEVPRGVDGTWASVGRRHRLGSLWRRYLGMLRVVGTRGAMGTLREACKRFRFVGAFAFEPERYRFSAQLRENGVSAGPDRVQHDA